MNATFRHGAVAEFDQAELAVIMMEAATGQPRPPGMDAIAALNEVEPGIRAAWLRAAAAALGYVEHVINNASPLQ